MEYQQASECYKEAWKLEFEASATVGFKYAFTLLKTKQAMQAVDVCEKGNPLITILNQPTINTHICARTLI